MNSRRHPEAISTQRVFQVYAALACVAGFLLLGWGPMWLGTDLAGQPWGKAALIRMAGATMIAAGCCAVGFAACGGGPGQRRGLLWFGIGHGVIWLVAAVQQTAIWGSTQGRLAVELLWMAAIVLLYLWSTLDTEMGRPWSPLSLFGNARAEPVEQLRSRYEQQIREVARQEERNRLARDLHDSIKQQIFAMQTAAATAQTRFGEDPAGARQALEQVRSCAREAMAEMQAMLDQLHGVPLENAGLIEALKKQCEALGFRSGAKVEFTFEALPAAEDFPPGAHEAILRVAQEALANVGRHARATAVGVSLAASGGRVELRVQDDGSGFDPNQTAQGQGIANMHDRAAEFGGTFELISAPGSGTTAVFAVPYLKTGTPREYRKRAMIWAMALLVGLRLLVWTNAGVIAAASAISAIGLARNLYAYFRVRRQSEGAH